MGHNLKTCQLQAKKFIRQVTKSHKWIQPGEGYKPGDIQLEKTVQVPRCATGGGGERTAEQRQSLHDLCGIKAEGKTQQIRKARTPTQEILLHVPSQIMPPTRPLQTPRFSNHLPHPPFLSLLADNLSHFRQNRSHRKKTPQLFAGTCFHYSTPIFQDDFSSSGI